MQTIRGTKKEIIKKYKNFCKDTNINKNYIKNNEIFETLRKNFIKYN